MDGSGSVSIPTSVTWVDRRQDPKLRFSLSNEGVITISGIKFSMFAKFDFPGVAPGQTEQFELPFSEVHVYAVLPIIFESFVGELVGQRIDSVVEALAVDGQWVFPFPRKTALDNIERLLSLFP